MSDKPTYQDLKKRVQELEKQLYERAYNIQGIPMQDREGRLIGAFEYGQDITERKEFEEALHESEEKYRGIVENANEGIAITQDGMFKFINSKSSKISGYSQHELISKPFIELVHIDDQSMVMQHHLKRLKGEEIPGKYELRFVAKDGNVKWLENNGVIVEWEGKPATLNFITDITDRKQVEQALRESEERFRAIFESAQDSIFIKDSFLKYTHVNTAMEKLFHLTAQELIGKTDEELFGKDAGDHIREVDSRVLAGEIVQEEHTKPVHETPITFDLTKVPLRDNSGEIVGLCGIARDITVRKHAEEALKESEAIHKEIFDKSPIPLYIQDFSKTADRIKELKEKNGVNDIKLYLQNNKDEVLHLIGTIKIIQANKAAFDMYQADSGDNLLQVLTPVIKSDDMQHVIDQIVDFTEGKDWYEGEARNFDLKGNVLDIMLRKAVINREKNGLSKIIVSLTDVTDLHRSHREKEKLETRIQQAQKMESIGTLAGGIAHDFNNILFPIVGYAEMLLEDVSEDSPLRNGLNEIYTGSLRARDLVHQILAFSRQESSELKLMKIQPIIKEALKLIRSTIPTTISINQNLQSDCGAVKADPTQIHQIIMNLTTNSYHAMEENGGELKVTLKEIKLGEDELVTPDMTPGSYACLTIADTGIGMDKKTIDKIFEPFFTTKGVGKGTGMGLSVVHGIVKTLNGVITVYSEPGKGTEFHVYLPVAKTSSIKEEPPANELLQCGTEKILLVDDEKSIIDMERQALERLGYHVAFRTSSIEALKAFRANPDKFDLIITDMAMPNMPGDKLAAELIKIRPDIPVLLCTGFSEAMTDEKIKSLGIKEFLLKPIIIKDLAKKIREVLDGSKGIGQKLL